MTIVLCVLLLLMAIFLTIAVLMQHGKSHNLSGTIAGGAETFFGKTKGRSMDAMLSKLTTIVAIIFVILVIVVYILQPNELTVTEIDGANTDNIVVDDSITNNDDTTATDDATTEDGAQTETPAEGDNAEGTEAPAEATDDATAQPEGEPEAEAPAAE